METSDILALEDFLKYYMNSGSVNYVHSGHLCAPDYLFINVKKRVGTEDKWLETLNELT